MIRSEDANLANLPTKRCVSERVTHNKRLPKYWRMFNSFYSSSRTKTSRIAKVGEKQVIDKILNLFARYNYLKLRITLIYRLKYHRYFSLSYHQNGQDYSFFFGQIFLPFEHSSLMLEICFYEKSTIFAQFV